jgi:signal peptidase
MSLVIAATAIFRRMLDLALLALILIVLTALVVARLIPAVTGGPTFVVGGGSMEPTIPLGSVVVDTPVKAADLAVGDVVSIKVGAAQAVFTHRITRLVPRDGALWIQTKGDANDTEDPSIVPAATVLGRVSVTIPALGYVVQLMATMAGVAFLMSLGMLTLLGAWLLEILEEDERTAWSQRRVSAGAMAVEVAAEPGAAG